VWVEEEKAKGVEGGDLETRPEAPGAQPGESVTVNPPSNCVTARTVLGPASLQPLPEVTLIQRGLDPQQTKPGIRHGPQC
jgi:hypothetical protein